MDVGTFEDIAAALPDELKPRFGLLLKQTLDLTRHTQFLEARMEDATRREVYAQEQLIKANRRMEAAIVRSQFHRRDREVLAQENNRLRNELNRLAKADKGMGHEDEAVFD